MTLAIFLDFFYLSVFICKLVIDKDLVLLGTIWKLSRWKHFINGSITRTINATGCPSYTQPKLIQNQFAKSESWWQFPEIYLHVLMRRRYLFSGWRRKEKVSEWVSSTKAYLGEGSKNRGIEEITWYLWPSSMRIFISPVRLWIKANTEKGIYKKFCVSLSSNMISWLKWQNVTELGSRLILYFPKLL